MNEDEAVRAQLATAITHVVGLLWVIDHHWLAFRLSAEERAVVDGAREFVAARGERS